MSRTNRPYILLSGIVGAMFVASLSGACGGDDAPDEPSATIAAPTNAPAATPTPAVDVAKTETALAKAYTENRTFVPRASIDGLKVTFDAATGTAAFAIRPSPDSKNTIGGNSGFLGGPSLDAVAITAQSALVAGKVTWKDHPAVKRVTVTVTTEFQLRTGAKLEEPAAVLTVDRASGEKMDFDALKATVPSNGRLFFCLADSYRIHQVTWQGLTDKGCLTTQTKGQ